jgi:aerobic C4-dicarboxylate transport protein
MSECRAVTNFIGNAVATIVVARWEGELDQDQLQAALSGHSPLVVDGEVLSVPAE